MYGLLQAQRQSLEEEYKIGGQLIIVSTYPPICLKIYICINHIKQLTKAFNNSSVCLEKSYLQICIYYVNTIIK